MKRIFLILFFFIFSVSCSEKKKECNFQQKSVEMSIYNDVLIELVEQHYYYRYLGKKGEKVVSNNYTESVDSVKESKQIIHAHNQLFGDTTLFNTIYLRDESISDSAIGNNYSYYNYGKSKSVDKMLASLSSNNRSVLDSINKPQFNYKAKNFHSCSFKVKSITDSNVRNFEKEIGIVSFSKVFVNKNEGVLRCDFNCGGLCGKGYILKVKKINNLWKIIEWHKTWIS